MKLQLKDSNSTLLFRAIEKMVKSDPTLARVVKTWCTFNGDVNEVFDPSDKHAPYVRLTPSSSFAHQITEQSAESPFIVEVYLLTNGTNSDDISNLWSAFQRAIFPGDNSAISLIQQFNAYGMVLRKAGYGPVKLEGGRMMACVGAIEATVLESSGV